MEQLGIVKTPSDSAGTVDFARIAYVASKLSEGLSLLAELSEREKELVLEALELTILERRPPLSPL